jgi:hypothetical protein
MVRSGLGFRALGLCALVAGVIAVNATSAQAEEGGVWLLGGKALSNYTVGLEPEVQSSLESAMVALLTEIIGKTVRFLCTTATLSGVKLQTGGLLKPGGSVRFTGCKTFIGKLNGKEEVIEEAESVPCEPFTLNSKTEKEAGVVVTNKLKGLLALNAAKETETLVEPETAGGPFATIHMSELCSIGEEVPVFGKLYLKDSKGEALVDKKEHLLEEDATLSKVWVISDTEEHLRTKLDGSAIVKLAGVHVGMTFAGHGALAEAEAEWLLGGKALSNYTLGLEPEVESRLENEMGALLTEIIGETVRFLCTTATLSGVKLQTGGLLKPGGSVRFTGCKTFLGKLNANKEVVEESESKPCEPFTGTEKGVVVTNKGKGLLALNAAKETETLVEPETAGGPFATIHMSEFCSIGEEVPVFGKLYLKDCNKEALVDKKEHLIEEDTTLSQLWVISDTEEHLRTKLDGSAIVKLAGAHTGMTFAGHAA